VGLASYYHDSLAGNRTANGDIYDPSAPTAAHKTLPLGTIVDVVRRNGRAVRVRINDRGPFVTGRVLDLSRGAATALDMIREGVVEVALFIVAWPPPKARKR
jgi:rare lipoprotein A